MAVILGIALFFVLMWALSLQKDLNNVASELNRVRQERTDILNSSNSTIEGLKHQIEGLKGQFAASQKVSNEYAHELQVVYERLFDSNKDH